MPDPPSQCVPPCFGTISGRLEVFSGRGIRKRTHCLRDFEANRRAAARVLKSAVIGELRGVVKMPGANRNDQPFRGWLFAMFGMGFSGLGAMMQEAGPSCTRSVRVRRLLHQNRAFAGQQAVEFLRGQTQGGQTLVRLEFLLQHRPGAMERAEALQVRDGQTHGGDQFVSGQSGRGWLPAVRSAPSSDLPATKTEPGWLRLNRLTKSSRSTRSILLNTIRVAFSSGTISLQHAVDRGDLVFGILARGVDHVDHQVGVAHLLQGGLEAFDQVMGQPPDEPHRVGQQEAAALIDFDPAGGGVQGGEELILDVDTGAGDAVHQGRFARVGVADQRRGVQAFARRGPGSAAWFRYP